MLHYPELSDVSSPPFNNPSLLLTYTFLTLFLKICDVQEQLAIASDIIKLVIQIKRGSVFCNSFWRGRALP
jgi:hypothetical protein